MSRMGCLSGLIASIYNPASQFSAGQLGAWYDPSDYATLSQDSAGTTPVTTAFAQPVGLMLDKRLGLVRGSELVDTANTTAPWTPFGTNTITLDGEEIKVTCVNNSDGARLQLDAVGGLSINLVSGSFYEVTARVRVSSGAVGVNLFDGLNSALQTVTSIAPVTLRWVIRASSTATPVQINNNQAMSAGQAIWYSNITAKEIPGNHILQATAPSRPVTSARVNLLTKSEQFDDVYWSKTSVTVTANSTVAPDGTTTADTLTATAGGGNVQRDISILGGLNYSVSVNILKTSGATTFPLVAINGQTGATTFAQVFLNTNTGVPTARGEGLTPGAANILVQNAGTFWKLSFSLLTIAANTVLQTFIYPAFSSDGTTANGTITGSCVAWGIQVEPGTVATRYQRVNTASDYDTVGFPQYQVFDGLDDGMATGAITLSADMDCFIAVRRATAGTVVLGFPIANAPGNFFGVVELASTQIADAGSGTPTYAANGLAINGGLANTTRGHLHTALPVASWVVLEIRNLNLSAAAWNAFAMGNYGAGFMLNGDFGGMILAPAGDATARQNNRRDLGKKVGLVLP